MTTPDTTQLQMLKAEETLFGLLGRTIYGVPDRGLFGAMVQEGFFDEVPFLDEQTCAPARDQLAAWARSCGNVLTDTAYEQVLLDYTRLFVGAQRVAAPLWESVYFNRERTVFEKQTMDVRKAYREFGMEVDKYGHEPDDHLAYELLFVSKLAHDAPQDFERCMAAQKRFLEAHLLTWVDAWRDLVVQKTPAGSFYCGFAELVVTACEEAFRFATA